MKNIFISTLLASFALFMSCNDDVVQDEFKAVLTVGENSYDLDGINFYQLNRGLTGDFGEAQDFYDARSFIITDATLVDPDGSTDIFASAYSGGSFVFLIALSTVHGEPFASASYVSIYDSDYAPLGTNRAYISFDAIDHLWLTALRDNESISEVNVQVLDDAVKFSFQDNMFDGSSDPYPVILDFIGSPVILEVPD